MSRMVHGVSAVVVCWCVPPRAYAQVDRATLDRHRPRSVGCGHRQEPRSKSPAWPPTPSRRSTTTARACISSSICRPANIWCRSKRRDSSDSSRPSRSRPARALAARRVAGGRLGRRNRDRRRRHAAREHRERRARHGRQQQRGREAAARHSQLGRPAGARARRAERPLYRAVRRHLIGPHRRRKRAWQPQPAEQLPARRRRQQQLLDQRPGADDADVAAVGGRD